MTNKQKPRRNSFTADLNTKEDDFILADLGVMPDEEDPSPVPLNHFFDDEETIDRLLVTTGFDTTDGLEDDGGEPDAVAFDDLDLADGFPDVGQFAVKPNDQAEKNPLTQTEKNPLSDIHAKVDFDGLPAEEDAIDRLLFDAGFDANDELEQDDGKPDTPMIDDTGWDDGFDVNFEGQDVMAADAGLFDPEENEEALDKDATHFFENPESAAAVGTAAEIKPELAFDKLNDPEITEMYTFKSEQENIKKLISACENKVKKAAVISYASLGFGFVALLVMGIIVSSVQTKVSKLTELVSILEEDMSSIAEKNADLEINNSDPSIGQLNQKVNALPERLEEQTRYSENGMAAEVTKQATANKSIDNQKASPLVPEKKKLSGATVDKVSAGNKNLSVKQPPASAEASKNKTTTAATKQATTNKSNDKLMARTSALAKKKPSDTVVKKVSAEKKANKTQATTSWSVNLTAYQDLADAKSKAAKFSQKGIPVKVIAVNMNNTKWYRLKVGGFKSKEEATAYAAKIKKSLKLNTVSVGNH